MHPFTVIVRNSDPWGMARRETVIDLLNAKEPVFGDTGIVVLSGSGEYSGAVVVN